MAIKSIIISFIDSDITSEYIANVLWRQNIAKVSKILLIPYLKNANVLQIAYVDIALWCDSEAAYNFVQRLKNPTKEARIIHKDDEWWLVEANWESTEYKINETYGTSFDTGYFVNERKIETIITEEDLDHMEECLELMEQEEVLETSITEEDLAHMEECQQLMEQEEYHLAREKPFIDWTLDCSNVTLRQCPAEEAKEQVQWIDDFFSYSQNVTLRPHQKSFKY